MPFHSQISSQALMKSRKLDFFQSIKGKNENGSGKRDFFMSFFKKKNENSQAPDPLKTKLCVASDQSSLSEKNASSNRTKLNSYQTCLGNRSLRQWSQREPDTILRIASVFRRFRFTRVRRVNNHHDSYTSLTETQSDNSPMNRYRYLSESNMSLRSKIKSRLASKPNPEDFELENPLFGIPSDVVTTITECLFNNRTTESTVRSSSIDLNLDIKESFQETASLRISYSKTRNISKPLPSLKLGPPPKHLPKEQHAKWERSQLFRHTAATFGQERHRSQRNISFNNSNFEPRESIGKSTLSQNISSRGHHLSIGKSCSREGMTPNLTVLKRSNLSSHFYPLTRKNKSKDEVKLEMEDVFHESSLRSVPNEYLNFRKEDLLCKNDDLAPTSSISKNKNHYSELR